jgi:phage-related minor tail protein
MLREMTVGIVFRDNNATQELRRINRLIDEARRNFNQLGTNIDSTESSSHSMTTVLSSGLNHVEDSAEDASHEVVNLGNEVHSAGSSFGLLGKAGVKAGAAIVAGLGGAVGAVAALVTEMDDAFSKFEAKTGATGYELEELKGIATDVFKKGFSESIAQAADDVALLNSMFSNLDYGEVQTIAEGAYTISDLWGAEINEVGRSVKTMMNVFGDEVSHTDALDLITTAFQKTGDYSDDLLDTFNEYSVYFKELGFGANGFTNILIKGAQNGAFTMDKAADAIKEFGIRSIDASETTAEGFKTIGLDAEKMTSDFAEGGVKAQNAFAATAAGLAAMKDPIKQNAAGVALFGTQWEDLREDVILAMTDGTDALGEFKGATQRATETMQDNFKTKMTQVWRDLQLGMAEAFGSAGGQELLNSFASVVESLVPKIEALIGKAVGFANIMRENWPVIKEVAIAVGTFVGVLATAKAGIAAVTGVIWLWNAALAANPITWVVVGIAALIAAGVLLYRNWDTVKEKAGMLWDKTKEVFGNIFNWAKEKIQPVVNFFKSLGDKFNDFKNAIANFKMPKWVTSIGSTIGNAASKVTGLFNGSHASGLARVPFDGYAAQLHKDESVLTADQSNALRNSGILKNNGGKPSLNLGGGSSSQIVVGDINIQVTETANGKQTAVDIRTELEDFFGSLMRRSPRVTEG